MPGRNKQQQQRRRQLKERAAAAQRDLGLREAGYLHRTAVRAFRSGDIPGAARLAGKALVLAPQHLPSLELLAQIHFEAEHYADALYYFRQLRKHSREPGLIYNCGLICFRMGRNEQALAEFREFLQAVGSFPEKKWFSLRKSALELTARLSEQGAGSTPVPQAPVAPPSVEPPSSPSTSAPLEAAEPAVEPPRRVDTVFVPLAVPVLADGPPGELVDHFLRRRLLELRRDQSFEELICLPTLTGVDSYLYQQETARRVLRHLKGRALLADEVGLGKTIEACVVLKEYWLRGMVRRALVLAPPSLVVQWKGELSEKFGLEPVSPDGPEFRQNPERFWNDSPLIVASIATARLDPHARTLASISWDMIIVDEAHGLKNRSSANWKLVNSLQKKFILMLTATPVENSLIELYNLISLLKPGLLSTEAGFRELFVTPGRPGTPKNPERLRSLLAEVMVRNTRAAVEVRLPPRIAASLVVPPTAEEEELYRRASAFVARRHRAAGRASRSDLALGSLLRQAGSSPQALSRSVGRLLAEHNGGGDGERRELEAILELSSQLHGSRKSEQLGRLLEARSGKMVVFTEFLPTLDHLARLCDRLSVPYAPFRGDLPRGEKDAAIARFRDEVDVLLSTGVGGEGRNLQFANTLVNFDLPWNPMRLEQRIGRVHRIGQTRDVFVFNLCQAGTVEEQILRVLHDKINMFELVVGEIDAILGALDDERDFADLVLELWLAAQESGRVAEAFDELADRLLEARHHYAQTKSLDEKLFHRDFEA